tara:strand:+ start:5219 stop:6184 length:966 start_codon:yes stop_codon:yes gene_type:complete
VATKPTPYQDLSWIQNDGLKPYTNPRPSDGIGRWEYWQGTFKEAFDSEGDAGTPFSYAKKSGSSNAKWQDTGTFGDNARLKLIEYDTQTSGYMTFTMADNWQGLFYVKSDNDDFFQDEVKESYIEGNWNDDDPFVEELGEAVNDLEDEGFPSIWVQENSEYTDSRMITGLDSGDYMSFDVDAESDKAAQSRVRLNGVDYLKNTQMDTNVYITCVMLRKWNPDYLWPALPEDDEEEEEEEQEDEEDETFNPCPEGQMLNEFGICVLIPTPEPEECEAGFEWNPTTLTCEPIYNPADDVSTFGMLALLGAIALVVFTAVKVMK